MPDLSSEQVQAFVDRGLPSTPAPAPAPQAGRGMTKVVSLRIPQEMHDKLTRIAAATPHSMNSFIVSALGPAVEAEMARIRRREELGL
jgi:hypothetical protein